SRGEGEGTAKGGDEPGHPNGDDSFEPHVQ
ncbi:MAG: hypothetical protein JWP75_1071, partial [Frondihabitans sp.]|nr:hypothetical protein [Frondihabitans sp.]